MKTKRKPPERKDVSLAAMRPHPRNYREHPDDQVEHLVRSIEDHGIYRDVVLARDLTILAGHGIAKAARKAGLMTLPAIVLDVGPNDPSALKLLAGDNEIGRLSEVDDRALTDLLKEFEVGDLLGTGFDAMSLQALLQVTRPESELAKSDPHSEWTGMPEFETGKDPVKLIVSFETEKDRAKFYKQIGATTINKNTSGVWSIWWPERKKKDLGSVRFQ